MAFKRFCFSTILLIVFACVAFVWTAPPALDQDELERRYSAALSGHEFRNVSRGLAARAEGFVASLREELLTLENSAPIDLVVSGGGFRGQYAGGVLSILMPFVREGRIRIKRYAGSSVGSSAIAHFVSGADTEEFFRVPYAWHAVWTIRAFWRGAGVVRAMVAMLPESIYFEPGELSIPVSLIAWPRSWCTLCAAETKLVTNFTSRDELLTALSVSAAIPGFTGSLLARWEGRLAMDSGFTCHTPVFTDGLRNQLVINLGALQHPLRYTLFPLDPEHEKLVEWGQDDIVALLRGEQNFNAAALHVLKPGDDLLEPGLWAEARRRWAFDLEPPLRAQWMRKLGVSPETTALTTTALALAFLWWRWRRLFCAGQVLCGHVADVLQSY